MSKKDDFTQAYEALVEETRVVRAFAGSEASRAIVSMLDALSATYAVDLIDVSPENLVRLQAQFKQVRAIRDLVADNGADTARI